MDVEWSWPCPSSPAAATTSKVLENDDLLCEILLRLIFPTSLVRAAAVCRRWLHLASDPAFLRRFRNLHPPRLLGLYVQTGRPRHPRFVPTPHPPPELAAAIRRAGSILDDVSLGVTAISDCRNGRLLVKLNNNPKRGGAVALLSPLHAAGDAAVLPPLPYAKTTSTIFTGHTSGLTAEGVVYAAVRRWYPLSDRVDRRFHELRDGTWHDLNSPPLHFPSRLSPAIMISRPFDGKLYMLVCASAIATLPLTLSRLPYLSIIPLPDGVEGRQKGSVKPWMDDSGLYLIDVKDLQLRVWLHVMDSGQWLLQNTICLREVCAELGVADLFSVDADGLGTTADAYICKVGHSAEFVLLKVGVDVLYIHIKSRNAEKVYTVKPGDSWTRLIPFVMIWPPIFPVIKEDKAQTK